MVSFVIVEYNSIDAIIKCVKAIDVSVLSDYEIIISSNSMYDIDHQLEYTSLLPRCKWVFNVYNGGFGYGMNRGMEKATGDYIVVMNPDCVILSKFDDIISFLRKYPIVGALGPQLVDEYDIIQDSCRPYVSLPRFIYRQLSRLFKHKDVITNNDIDYSKVQTVDWIIGAFIVVPSEIYRITSGFNEKYFMYAEDLDWCTRIRKAGYEVVYYPKFKVRYKGTRSARSSVKYAKIFIRSHIKYWKSFGFFGGYPTRRDMTFNL